MLLAPTYQKGDKPGHGWHLRPVPVANDCASNHRSVRCSPTRAAGGGAGGGGLFAGGGGAAAAAAAAAGGAAAAVGAVTLGALAALAAAGAVRDVLEGVGEVAHGFLVVAHAPLGFLTGHALDFVGQGAGRAGGFLDVLLGDAGHF